MSTVTIQHKKTSHASMQGTFVPAERLDAIRRTFGMWKRPLKQSLRELIVIRRGLDRKLP